MAKGDSKRAREEINRQTDISQGWLDQIRGQQTNMANNINNNPANPFSPQYQPTQMNFLPPGVTSNVLGLNVPTPTTGGIPIPGLGPVNTGGIRSDFPTNFAGATPAGIGSPSANFTPQDIQRISTEMLNSGQARRGTAGLQPLVDRLNQEYGGGFQVTGRPGDADTIMDPRGHILDLISSAERPIYIDETETGAGGVGGGFGGFGGGYGNGIGSILGAPNTAGFNPALSLFGAGQNFQAPSNQAIQGALGGYGEFAQTGGFSPNDISNIRARAIAPIRAIYQLGQDELTRQRALSGGYNPGFGAAQAKMARQQSQAIGDQAINVEAMLADAIRSGRMAGISGLGSLGPSLGGLGLQQQLGLIGAGNQRELGLGNLGLGYGNLGLGYGNLDLGFGNLGLGYGNLGLGQQRLGSDTMLGLGNLGLGYTNSAVNQQLGLGNLGLGFSTLGLNRETNMGNLNLGTGNLGLGIANSQNNLGLGTAANRVSASQIPGNYSQALGNIGGTLNLAGQVVRGISGIPGLGGQNLVSGPSGTLPVYGPGY